MTDDTEELDELLNNYGLEIYKFKLYEPSAEWDAERHKAKQAIIDWHNKQMGAVLDRLEGRARGAFDYEADIEEYAEDVLTSIEAERNRLNPSKSTPFNKPKESSND